MYQKENNGLEQGKVDLKIKDAAGWITFSHPRSNSLPGKTLAELAQTISDAGMNDSIRVIVLQSAGDRAFCAGASFDELIEINDTATGERFFNGFANVINAARKCPKLIIGRIQGKAVGGGVGLAAATDYCLASEQAFIKLSELAIGIGPFVVGPAIERKVGLSSFSEMAINAAEWKDAEWAKNKGLYTQIFTNLEELDKAVAELAGQLSRYSEEAMRSLKAVLWEGTDHWDQLLKERAAISGQLVLSDFTKKAIEDFKTRA